MNTKIDPCDGCSNAIIRNVHDRPMQHTFNVPIDGGWESYDFLLCVECKSKIVEELLDEDESPPRVDGMPLRRAVEWYRAESERFEETADDLEELLDDV